MLKLILGVLFVASTTLIGAKIAEKKKFVSYFFEKLKAFNDRLSLDVSLYPAPLSDALSALSDQTHGVLTGYEKMFEGEEFVCKDKRFSKGERELIGAYVNSLGRYDSAGEGERLSLVKESLKRAADESREKERRFSALAIKLSFSFGLAVFILFI